MGEDHKEAKPERLLQRQRNITSVQSLFIITRFLFVLFILYFTMETPSDDGDVFSQGVVSLFTKKKLFRI